MNSSLSLSLSELEAKEACEWLRAAGFPQYAQLYEGNPELIPQKSTQPLHVCLFNSPLTSVPFCDSVLFSYFLFIWFPSIFSL